MMGGNDGQGITLANGQVLPDGTDAWAKEYRRRVEVVMRIFSDNGKRRGLLGADAGRPQPQARDRLPPDGPRRG